MKVDFIEIKNFRKLQSCRVDFDKEKTLLVGANNSGKTSAMMASKNVRVDSLFLDEGFGTLDEEALDTALETLAGLQQDGKLIGVISHVPALKERISTQIQVITQTGGRSLISGPGCGKVSAEA